MATTQFPDAYPKKLYSRTRVQRLPHNGETVGRYAGTRSPGKKRRSSSGNNHEGSQGCSGSCQVDACNSPRAAPDAKNNLIARQLLA